ncbi:hypothetical protein LCGC14_0643170 [marine sediment metagenome]|uniref:Uncharacterized protein n=1 Tax=marine sediment metagenome TaxID=412755 RepID=A0A0F9RI58_9ZZZZ
MASSGVGKLNLTKRQAKAGKGKKKMSNPHKKSTHKKKGY